MFIKKLMVGIIIIVAGFLIPRLYAQPNLILENMTITSTETYNADNSITAGPDFTIAGSGKVTFGTPNVYLRGEFVIENGGQFTVLNAPLSGIETSDNPVLTSEFSVGQNYPNPFNPTTRIRYVLPHSEKVEVVVYNVFGQTVIKLVSQYQPAGRHSISWDGRNDAGNKVGSGIYYYRVNAGKYSTVKKMIFLK